jgi:hypothetical protein
MFSVQDSSARNCPCRHALIDQSIYALGLEIPHADVACKGRIHDGVKWRGAIAKTGIRPE